MKKYVFSSFLKLKKLLNCNSELSYSLKFNLTFLIYNDVPNLWYLKIKTCIHFFIFNKWSVLDLDTELLARAKKCVSWQKWMATVTRTLMRNRSSGNMHKIINIWNCFLVLYLSPPSSPFFKKNYGIKNRVGWKNRKTILRKRGVSKMTYVLFIHFCTFG